jgi:hypothetical protein
MVAAGGRRWSSVRLVTLDAKEPLTPDAALTVPATGSGPKLTSAEAAALRA